MHEMGIAEGILEIVLGAAGECPVRRVQVRVGDELRVVADSLEFSFQLIAEGTACAGASLVCIAAPGAEILMDEVELAGDPPTVLRRSGVEIHETAHAHDHPGQSDAEMAPVAATRPQGDR